MALFRYPGIFSKTAVFAIVILALAVVTPVAASSVSNSNFWDYGGIAYGYSVNLQSTSTYPVIGNFRKPGNKRELHFLRFLPDQDTGITICP